jgi:hypothetical protein
MDQLHSLTPEQRRYAVRMLREAADYIESSVSEPLLVGSVIWEVLLGLDRKQDAAKEDALRNRPPAA